MSLRTMIADDEPLARERLKMLLAPDPDIEIVAENAGRHRLGGSTF